MKLEDSQRMIAEECDTVRSLLLAKNEQYGDAALNPRRIFSTSDAMEQIRVRIDDKLSRLANMREHGATTTFSSEDTEQDLIGYLVLLRVARRIQQNSTKGKT